jgi:HAE1 family hydrophobic/amphiphilic exporter-1
MGYVVIGGMLAASFMGIFLIPVLFYIVEKLTGGKTQTKKPAEPATPATQPGVIPAH